MLKVLLERAVRMVGGVGVVRTVGRVLVERAEKVESIGLVGGDRGEEAIAEVQRLRWLCEFMGFGLVARADAVNGRRCGMDGRFNARSVDEEDEAAEVVIVAGRDWRNVRLPRPLTMLLRRLMW